MQTGCESKFWTERYFESVPLFTRGTLSFLFCFLSITDCCCCAFERAYYNRLTFLFCLSGVPSAPKLSPRRVIPTPSRIWVCMIELFLCAAAPTMHPLKDAFTFAVLDITALRSAINTCHARMPFLFMFLHFSIHL